MTSSPADSEAQRGVEELTCACHHKATVDRLLKDIREQAVSFHVQTTQLVDLQHRLERRLVEADAKIAAAVKQLQQDKIDEAKRVLGVEVAQAKAEAEEAERNTKKEPAE